MYERKISVVMTVYNSEKYVSESIESVLNQSFSDFELIIVDDGSTDHSLDIIRRYQDDRIKLLINDRNSGICYSSNRGIAEATGEYIARIDSDDICHRERFKKQVDFLDANTDIFMCATWRNLLYEDGKLVESNERITKNNEIGYMLLFGNSMITHSTVMFRREQYERAGYSYERFIQAHDYKLWTQFIVDDKKIEIIPEVLLDYRLNDSGITATNTQARNKKEADTIKHEYIEAMGVDTKTREALGKNIDGVPIAQYYQDFELAVVEWARMFYSEYQDIGTDGYEAISNVLWKNITSQKLFSLHLLKTYCSSRYTNNRRLFTTIEGVKVIIKCLIGRNGINEGVE